ncbi:hypothetical protein [Sphingobium ummariense]|nr:hypothetical protein [Sphingobium ummariense]
MRCLFGVEAVKALEDVHEAGHGGFPGPIALELAIHLHAADQLRARMLLASTDPAALLDMIGSYQVPSEMKWISSDER